MKSTYEKPSEKKKKELLNKILKESKKLKSLKTEFSFIQKR